jgi:hypothetical protein
MSRAPSAAGYALLQADRLDERCNEYQRAAA